MSRVSKKKSAGKKSAGKRTSTGQSDKTEQNRTLSRVYPELPLEQEKALVLLSSGRTVTDTARELHVGRGTIYEWMKQPAFQAAWKEEEFRLMEELRKIAPSINVDAYAAIQNFLRDPKAPSAEKAKLAEKYLKDSGFLVLSDSAEEQKKQIEEAAQIIAGVVAKHTGK